MRWLIEDTKIIVRSWDETKEDGGDFIGKFYPQFCSGFTKTTILKVKYTL